ncbi:hypothetical protein AXFE_17160 [Acidithrix ferrooxidans]|uniref:Glyoxalase-like domain protein n=1 Tax=Acidithrix ferrooxidans TaxID=1280514 RepID=A0A0D8HHQ0_9ACTN|nr:hypothetical protein AXFE_17160 [Acidithrix ferrooxidans]
MISDPNFSEFSGQLSHLGVKTSNVDQVERKTLALGATELPRGLNWIRFQGSVCIELLQFD